MPDDWDDFRAGGAERPGRGMDEPALERMAEGIESAAARLRELEVLERGRRRGAAWQGLVLAAILAFLLINLAAHAMSIRAARARAPIDRLREDLVGVMRSPDQPGLNVVYRVYPQMVLRKVDRRPDGVEYRAYFLSDEELRRAFQFMPDEEKEKKAPAAGPEAEAGAPTASPAPRSAPAGQE